MPEIFLSVVPFLAILVLPCELLMILLLHTVNVSVAVLVRLKC